MTEIYIHFLFDNYGLYGNAPVATAVARLTVYNCFCWLTGRGGARGRPGDHAFCRRRPRSECGVHHDHDRVQSWLFSRGKVLSTVCFHIIGNLETMHDWDLPTFLMDALPIIWKRTRISAARGTLRRNSPANNWDINRLQTWRQSVYNSSSAPMVCTRLRCVCN